MSARVLVDAQGLSRSFGDVDVLHDIDLTLREGEIVEIDTAERIWRNPQHEYTRTLLSSFPRLTGERGVVVR